eukprot:gnl/MRDRNA2_/MRDRNA2_82881_c0_seq8.p1 gnl/MRDRNA2_/MRDRNA2_82881_c0~~gnl/MRDRNA2_/MRDRNA2_82881_c0_seq8.p1  ORF type:complete len:168 (+),score=30.14 gnl/MRDRNA2_/MRDRNA2_82881_c0_seq8:98-601(+)
MPDNDSFDIAVQAHASVVKSYKPDIIVGSSYGAALVIELMSKNVWKGPTVLLAQAYQAVRPQRKPGPQIPEGVACTLVHGLRDDLVPVEHSMELAKTGTEGLVRIITPDDTHELPSLLMFAKDPTTSRLSDPIVDLQSLVRETYSRQNSKYSEVLQNRNGTPRLSKL